MSKRPTKRMHREMFSAELNLMPIMNLFMVLIPFLLLTAIFVKTATIDIHLPQEVKASQAKQANKAKSLGPVTIKITKSGFMFEGLGKSLPRVANKNGKYNFIALNNRLKELKDKYPKEKEAILLIPKDFQYEKVIKAMDALREFKADTNGIIKTTELFPVVSLGSL